MIFKIAAVCIIVIVTISILLYSFIMLDKDEKKKRGGFATWQNEQARSIF